MKVGTEGKCRGDRVEPTITAHTRLQGVFGLCSRFDFEHDDIQHDLFSGEWMIEVDHG